MKKVYSARAIDELHRGGGLGSIPSDAIITPSARDRMKELGADNAKRNGSPAKGGGSDGGIDQAVRATSPKADLERLFNCPAVTEL